MAQCLPAEIPDFSEQDAAGPPSRVADELHRLPGQLDRHSPPTMPARPAKHLPCALSCRSVEALQSHQGIDLMNARTRRACILVGIVFFLIGACSYDPFGWVHPAAAAKFELAGLVAFMTTFLVPCFLEQLHQR